MTRRADVTRETAVAAFVDLVKADVWALLGKKDRAIAHYLRGHQKLCDGHSCHTCERLADSGLAEAEGPNSVTIEEFIAARLDEEGRRVMPSPFDPYVPALRALLDQHFDDGGHCAVYHAGEHRPPPWPCRTAKLTAAIWADHPDYQQVWVASGE